MGIEWQTMGITMRIMSEEDILFEKWALESCSKRWSRAFLGRQLPQALHKGRKLGRKPQMVSSKVMALKLGLSRQIQRKVTQAHNMPRAPFHKHLHTLLRPKSSSPSRTRAIEFTRLSCLLLSN